MIKDGNSIFIFEVAGLCIGHLGHLHHKLDENHFAAIGRLDIVMVPIANGSAPPDDRLHVLRRVANMNWRNTIPPYALS
jgi:L-ascorbate metabolism protein UlaG (beta-lactamase superfamily)